MYASLSELIASFSQRTIIQLSNDDPMAKSVDNDVLNYALTQASERIDASLRSRYVLPLTETPTLLNRCCLNLARHWLYSRRPETKLPDGVKDGFKQAIDELNQIASGKLHLGIVDKTTDDSLPAVASYKVASTVRIDTRGY